MKSILIDVNLKGRGIVNFDGGDQKWLFKGSEKFKSLYTPHDNVKYSKKVFYKDDDNQLSDFKIKISDKCIKKAIFNNDMVGQNTNFIQNSDLKFMQIGSPLFMLSGYVITVKNGISYKKKSPITLTDAIQTNNVKPILDTNTRSGFKQTKSDDTDKSDTTFFKVESVGDITYNGKGTINLNELQFVSLDDYYDRWAFSVDEFEYFKKYFKMQVKSFNSEPGYFKIKDSQNSIPELGIKFSQEDVDFMVKYYLKRLLTMKILRNNAYAEIDNLRIKFVDDCVLDTFNSTDKWIEINSIDDINNLKIVYDDFYVEMDTIESENIRKEINDFISKKNEVESVDDKKKNVRKKLDEK